MRIDARAGPRSRFVRSRAIRSYSPISRFDAAVAAAAAREHQEEKRDHEQDNDDSENITHGVLDRRQGNAVGARIPNEARQKLRTSLSELSGRKIVSGQTGRASFSIGNLAPR